MALKAGLYMQFSISTGFKECELCYDDLPTFSKMRRDGIDFDCLGTNETGSGLLVPVHAA